MNSTTITTRTFHFKQLHLLIITMSTAFTSGVLIKTLDWLSYDLNGLSFALDQTSLTAFISLFYIAMLIGGIASRVYESNNNILIGYLLAASGLFIALYPSTYLIGITTYIVGNGLILPNTYVHVSHQYAPSSSARTLYLFGLFTALNASLAIGLLAGSYFLQHSAFTELLTLGGIMTVSLFAFMMVNFSHYTVSIGKGTLVSLRHQLEYVVIINILIFGGIGLFSYTLHSPWLSSWGLVTISLAAFIFVISFTVKSHADQRARNIIILCLFFLGGSYWVTNTILTYCLSTYLPLGNLFNVGHVNTTSLTVMTMILERIGLVVALPLLMIAIYLSNKFFRHSLSLINLIGIALVGAVAVVIVFTILNYLPGNMTHPQQQKWAIILLSTMGCAKALIIPCIIVLIGQLTPRRQEGLFISFFLITLGLSIIIGQQFLISVNWSIALTHTHPVYSYYQLSLVTLILIVAAFVLFFGLLRPIWGTVKTLN